MKFKKIFMRALCIILSACLLIISPVSKYFDTQHIENVEAAFLIDDTLLIFSILSGLGIYLSYDWAFQGNHIQQFKDSLAEAYETERNFYVVNGSPLFDDDDDDDNDVEPDDIPTFDQFLEFESQRQLFQMNNMFEQASMYILCTVISGVLTQYFLDSSSDDSPFYQETFEARNNIDISFGEDITVGYGGNDISMLIELNNPDYDFEAEIFSDTSYLASETYTYQHTDSQGTPIDDNVLSVSRYYFADGYDISDVSFVFTQYPESASEFYVVENYDSNTIVPLSCYTYEVYGSSGSIPSYSELWDFDYLNIDTSNENCVIRNTYSHTRQLSDGTFEFVDFQTVLSPHITIYDDSFNLISQGLNSEPLWIHPDMEDTFDTNGSIKVAPPLMPYYHPTLKTWEDFQKAMNTAETYPADEKASYKNNYIGDFIEENDIEPVVNPSKWPQYSPATSTDPEPDVDETPDSDSDNEQSGFWTSLWEWLKRILNAILAINPHLESIVSFLSSLKSLGKIISDNIANIKANVLEMVSGINILSDIKTFVSSIPSKLQSLLNLVESIPSAIIESIENALERVFIPDEAYIDSEVADLRTDFSLVDDVITIFTDLENRFSYGSEPPKIYIHFEEAEDSKYAQLGTMLAIDFAWYARYKPYGDAVISAILWAFFLLRLIKGIPNIIKGLDYTPVDSNVADSTSLTVQGGQSPFDRR